MWRTRNKKQFNCLHKVFRNNQIILNFPSKYIFFSIYTRDVSWPLCDHRLFTKWRMIDLIIDNCGTWICLQSNPRCQLSRWDLTKLDFDNDMSIMIRDWYCSTRKQGGLNFENVMVVGDGSFTLIHLRQWWKCKHGTWLAKEGISIWQQIVEGSGGAN